MAGLPLRTRDAHEFVVPRSMPMIGPVRLGASFGSSKAGAWIGPSVAAGAEGTTGVGSSGACGRARTGRSTTEDGRGGTAAGGAAGAGAPDDDPEDARSSWGVRRRPAGP